MNNLNITVQKVMNIINTSKIRVTFADICKQFSYIYKNCLKPSKIKA